MARGRLLVLHHHGIKRLSFYLFLGFKIRSPSSPNLGISRIKIASFHPQSNGMIERFHRSLKSSLRARLASSDWVSHLPLVMLGLQSSPKDDSGFSLAKAVYGSNLSLPGEFLEHSEIPPDSFLGKVDLAVVS